MEQMELQELVDKYTGYFIVNYEENEVIYSEGYENENGLWCYKISDLDKMPDIENKIVIGTGQQEGTTTEGETEQEQTEGASQENTGTEEQVAQEEQSEEVVQEVAEVENAEELVENSKINIENIALRRINQYIKTTAEGKLQEEVQEASAIPVEEVVPETNEEQIVEETLEEAEMQIADDTQEGEEFQTELEIQENRETIKIKNIAVERIKKYFIDMSNKLDEFENKNGDTQTEEVPQEIVEEQSEAVIQ